MDDGVQARQRGGVGEHDGPQALAVDGAVGGDDLAAELADHLLPAGRTGPVDLVPDPVGVDHQGAELGQHRRRPRSCRIRSRR